MSKAFVKDDSVVEEFVFEPLELGVGLVKLYLTPAGMSKLMDDLTFMQTQEPTTPNKKRVELLEKWIRRSEVIDPRSQTGPKARFGATVTVKDENEQTLRYQIVGISEADSSSGKVSYISPIGKVLLGTQVGDMVQLDTPQGELELEIINVEYV